VVPPACAPVPCLPPRRVASPRSASRQRGGRVALRAPERSRRRAQPPRDDARAGRVAAAAAAAAVSRKLSERARAPRLRRACSLNACVAQRDTQRADAPAPRRATRARRGTRHARARLFRKSRDMLRPAHAAAAPQRRWALLALLALLACARAPRCAARPFTPELPGADTGSGDGGASAEAHAAAHAAAAAAHGAAFWKKDIVIVLTWHAADIAWLAELPLRHVRATARAALALALRRAARAPAWSHPAQR
jgi:hypothetical protein